MEIISQMGSNAQHDDPSVRLASIQTLGYICEDLDDQYISAENMDSILFAVLENINPQNLEMTRISIKAFARAAPLTGRNFENDTQRQYIMDNLMKAASIPDEEVLEYLASSLIDIARVSYDNIIDHI